MEHFIDAHQHFWDISLFKYPWLNPDLKPLFRSFLPEDLKNRLSSAGVSKTVVVQAMHSLEETMWLLELSQETGFIGGVVGWAPLENGDVGEILDRFCRFDKFKGIRHQAEDEKDREWLVKPGVLNGLREVSKRNLKYDILIKTDQLYLLDEVAYACPDLEMVIDHAAKPPIRLRCFDVWAESIQKVSKLPNVMCKVSGLITEADHLKWSVDDLKPYADHLIKCFGYDRLMFGSDWPVCLLAGTYEKVLDSMRVLLKAAAEKDRHKVFYQNAQRFYAL